MTACPKDACPGGIVEGRYLSDFAISRRSLIIAASLLAVGSFHSVAAAEVPPFNLQILGIQLSRYASDLESFLQQYPIDRTNWGEKKFWDGGDNGLISGALDYDLVGRSLQLYNATKDKSYLKLAVDAALFLRASYIEPNKGILPAYRIYCAEGFHSLTKVVEKSDPSVGRLLKRSVSQIASSAAYAQLNDRNRKAIFHPSLSREVALLLQAKILANDESGSATVGGGGKLPVEPFVSAMKNHFRLFIRSLESKDKRKELWGAEMKRLGEDPENYLLPEEFVRPFMVAISARSAAKFAQFTGDQELVNLAADTLLALSSIYVQGKGLPYTDRNLPEQSRARQLSADVKDSEVVPALNHMVANACEAVGVHVDSKKKTALLSFAHRIRADLPLGELTLKEAKQANY